MFNHKKALSVSTLWLHAASVVVACTLFVLALLFAERTTNVASPAAILTQRLRVGVVVFAGVGVAAGFGFMATRSGPNESLVVAASTILVFILVVLAH